MMSVTGSQLPPHNAKSLQRLAAAPMMGKLKVNAEDWLVLSLLIFPDLPI